MFEIGSRVVYRAEGVCVISDIRSESFGSIGKSEKYYILTPIGDKKSTVFVPINNECLVGYMRELMSAEKIEQMLCELRDERMEWIVDSRARNAVFREILSLGDRRDLVVLVNTVWEKIEEQRLAGKKPGSTDLGALAKAERLLYEEFAATTDIGSQENVMGVLRGEIRLRNKK